MVDIHPWAKISSKIAESEQFADASNGVTLCATCHKATYRREHLFEERLTQLVAGA